ncbi:MAG: flippase-like domain-containing protein [Anaerolineaceae bacterium]|nr:flippase-like domain-containing protein [Anaerolineaceae bacterium]
MLIANIDVNELVIAFRSINFFELLLALALALISLCLRVFSWRIILKKQFSFKRLFFVMNAGYLMNNVFPFRLGEIGRALLLGSRNDEEIGSLEVLSSVLVERIYDIFLAAFFFLGSLLIILREGSLQMIAILLLSLAVITLIMLSIAARKREAFISKLMLSLEKRPKILLFLVTKLDSLLKGLTILNKPNLILSSFGLLLLSWVFSLGQHYIIMQAIIPGYQGWWPVFILSSGAFGIAIPAAPAGIGVFEAAIVGAFALLGIESSIALAYALILHAMQFVISSGFGFIGLILEGQSISSLIKKTFELKRDQPQVL